MLDLDQWQEIFGTIRKNKLRTFLTGFSVAWGIFMLVLLLGAGNGLSKGVLHNFSDAKNSVWMGGGLTSTSYKGLNAGRKIDFNNNDIAQITNRYANLENISACCDVNGSNILSYKNNYGDFNVQAINVGHQNTEAVELLNGRLLNPLDMKEFRKVVLIGKNVKEQLFKEEDPIGKYINYRGIPLKVIGVFGDVQENETKRIFIPITLGQKLFIPKNQVGRITFTTGNASLNESTTLIEEIKKDMAKKYNFSTDDQSAMWVWNALKDYQQMQSLFSGISFFVLVIGIFTIIAGIVGVSNIMLIVVKERTKEIGIRKAIGAKPSSIIKMIILEAILVTAASGYLGMVVGILLLESIAKVMPASDFFRNPGIDFSVAIWATVFIVLAGVIAGYIPARKAANIRPVVALHDE